MAFSEDLSVFKIAEKCSNYYHFLFRMYCVVIRFSLRLFCDQSFGKYVYMANLLSQRVTVGALCSFSNLSFRTQLTKLPYLLSSFIFNISSRRSYIPNSLPNKSQMQRTIFQNFVKIAFDGYFTSSIKKDIPRLELKCDFEHYTWFRVVFKCKQNMTGADHKTQR